MALLELADDRVAPADLEPRLAVVIEREDPRDLALDSGGVRVALDLAVDDAGVVLADDHARVPAKVVAAEREPHGCGLGLRASRVRAEAEAREQTEIERAARGHRERAGFLHDHDYEDPGVGRGFRLGRAAARRPTLCS